MPAIKKFSEQQRKERIVKALKIGLVNKGWTVRHLAELCGMLPSNMSHLLNNPMKVKLETILIVAEKLEIDSIPT